MELQKRIVASFAKFATFFRRCRVPLRRRKAVVFRAVVNETLLSALEVRPLSPSGEHKLEQARGLLLRRLFGRDGFGAAGGDPVHRSVTFESLRQGWHQHSVFCHARASEPCEPRMFQKHQTRLLASLRKLLPILSTRFAVINAAPAHGKVNVHCGATKSKNKTFVAECSLVRALSAIVFLHQKTAAQRHFDNSSCGTLVCSHGHGGALEGQRRRVVEKLHWPSHDQSLRELDAWSTHTWTATANWPRLLEHMEMWKSKLPLSSIGAAIVSAE
eukprot:s285_g31.t1